MVKQYYIILFDDKNIIKKIKDNFLENKYEMPDTYEEESIYEDHINDISVFNCLIENKDLFRDLGINLYIEKFNYYNYGYRLYTIKFRFNSEYYDIPIVEPIKSINCDNLYDLYKNNIFPKDYIIKGLNKSYDVHKIILYINGDEYIKKYMSPNFIESTYNYINLSNFNNDTIEIFVDYIYIGQIIEEKIKDIIELYELAEYLQNKNLIIDTLNIINYNSDVKDLPTLNILYEKYKNPYLFSIIQNIF